MPCSREAQPAWNPGKPRQLLTRVSSAQKPSRELHQLLECSRSLPVWPEAGAALSPDGTLVCFASMAFCRGWGTDINSALGQPCVRLLDSLRTAEAVKQVLCKLLLSVIVVDHHCFLGLTQPAAGLAGIQRQAELPCGQAR